MCHGSDSKLNQIADFQIVEFLMSVSASCADARVAVIMFPEYVTKNPRDGLSSCLRGCDGPRISDEGERRGMTLNAGWR